MHFKAISLVNLATHLRTFLILWQMFISYACSICCSQNSLYMLSRIQGPDTQLATQARKLSPLTGRNPKQNQAHTTLLLMSTG